MSMTNESALLLIGDEVRATLRELNTDLEALANSDSAARLSSLAECDAKIHAIAGAFHVASLDALLRYALALQEVIHLWRASPSSLLPQTLATMVSAGRSLHDFLQAAQEQKSVSELALFQDYQKIGAVVSRTLSPLDLWSASEGLRCMNIWSEPDFANALQVQIERHFHFYDPSAIELSRVDVLMLTLIRQQQRDAATELGVICDWRGLQGQSSQHLACSVLVSAVIDALANGCLELDLFLKRYLLSSLTWFKSGKLDDSFLNESIFFAYLAWQATHDVEHDTSDSFELLAQAANWQAQKGTRYNQAHFDPQARDRMARAHAVILDTKQVWADFCAATLDEAPENKSAELGKSFDKMGQALEVLHPAALELSQAFHVIVGNYQLCAKRDVQIEVATLLLILSSMLEDMSVSDHAQTEYRLLGLVRRLQALKNEQATGAFEPWMLELQKRQDWLQAMTSTTEQLGQKLTEIEEVFERLWSAPHDVSDLAHVCAKLQQIRAIAHSLKLDDFAYAVKPVEEKLESLMQSKQVMDEQTQKQMAADIASLGLMLSMWAHKPEQAYRALTSRTQEQAPIETQAMAADEVQSLAQDEPIERVFLAEAHDVLVQALDAVQNLCAHPEDREALIGLRRAFHTLKGGARVVGLMQYGEAAWLLEQHLNERLAEQTPLSTDLLELCTKQIQLMQGWTEHLETQNSFESLSIDWQLGHLQQSLQAFAAPIAAPAATALTLDLPPADFLDLQSEAQMKTIGDLQISIPLYQAYLNETDEWSRQLALALSEWMLDDAQPIPSQTLTWAHALAGSSATIGFDSCAKISKLVERLIERVQEQGVHSTDLARVLSNAADEIQRLLHQFAAGFLKSADPLLVEQLKAYLEPSHALSLEPLAEKAPSTFVVQPLTNAFADAEMKAVFEEESAQLIPELGAALRSWDKAQALRTLHTLKGSARLVGEQLLAGQAHDLESHIEAIGEIPSEAQLAELLKLYDQLAIKPASQPRLIAPLPATAQVVSRPQPFVPVTSGETIRVQSQTVDRLVNQTGELMIARSRMEAEMTRSLRTLSDMGLQVQRLRDQLREMEIQTESQMQSRQAQVTDAANSFDPLELDRFTRTQELTRFMAEALSDISTLQRSLQRSLNTAEDDLSAQLRQTRDLQRNLLRTRMVDFDSAGERLHRLVRMTSQELHKSVELIIQNGGQEMDRSVLERMLPVFEHLLRNAVVHGIELPSEREAKGKAAQGKITIQLTQQSNDVIVNLQDDGRGIDHQALLRKARDRLGQPDLNADASQLIFMSGLSVASEVSELAGRGIGMDVVRNQIFALGGRIEVTSTHDTGTLFKLILPLTTAVTQIVLVRTGTHMTGIPGNLVSTIVRVKPEQVVQAKQNKFFVHGDQTYPFFGLGQLLQYQSQVAHLEQPTQNIMLLQSAGQMIALHVDEVLGNQEVMVKNLGTQLAQMPGLSGMTVLPTGPTILIYNPVALAAVYGAKLLEATDDESQLIEDASRADRVEATHAAVQTPLVLVVDDSITMRRVLQRLLQREGYRVTVAADGRQALDALRLERPALVLSDVEMPRMDGFELLRSIRASETLRHLPVVMITSRIADKHRDHAQELGANEYLGKPYSEDELLQVLERYATKVSE
jgi:chemosensory pili system protein ChpA (sensor histidine kinase/response regulator)